MISINCRDGDVTTASPFNPFFTRKRRRMKKKEFVNVKDLTLCSLEPVRLNNPGKTDFHKKIFFGINQENFNEQRC